MTRGMRWGPPFYRKKRAETLAYYKHVISHVISNINLYKICTSNYAVFVMFFVIISDFPKLFCATGSKMFNGFQRLSQTFHVLYSKSRNSRGKAQSRTHSRGVILERLDNTGGPP